MAPDVRDHTITSQDNLRLYVHDMGPFDAPKPPILCLPGITRNHKDFLAPAAHWAQSRRVLMLDFRGRGKSENDPVYMNYHPLTYANDALTVLAALGVHKTVVVGTSLGGLVTMVMAVVRPTVLGGAVINDIGPVVDPRGLDMISTFVGHADRHPTFQDAADVMKSRWQDNFPDVDAAHWRTMTEATHRQTGAAWIPDHDPNIGRALAEGAGQTDQDPWALWGAMRHIPTLSIRGALSVYFSAEIQERMKAVKPDLATLVVENRGHCPVMDEPDAQAAIDAFLAEVDRAQPGH